MMAAAVHTCLPFPPYLYNDLVSLCRSQQSHRDIRFMVTRAGDLEYECRELFQRGLAPVIRLLESLGMLC
jgi:hypothetical protein